ncbi:glycosyltransferase, partial [Candidatus Poribacteria bacterium]|nr:glycosyltransferase [Candidatus Poribacteria bacterium]
MKRKKRNRNPHAPSIALCMIVKNEAANLERCLKTVQPLVSEINIVDTGSTDNTIEIARRNGASVQAEQWMNDYSRPRNTSLKMASADWILVLDADETLDSDAIATIRVAVRKPGIAGYVLPTRNYMDDSSVANFVPNDGSCELARAFKGWVESRKVRLFRRRPGIQFEGEIHEVIGPSIRRANGRTEFLDAVVHHFGFLAPVGSLKEKTRKMAALAEAKCAGRNGNCQAHYELGVISAKLDNLEKAESCFRKAIALRYDFALAHYDLAVVLARMGRNEEAVSEYRSTLKLDPNNADALCNLAVCLQKLHCDKDAEETYRSLLEKHPLDTRGWNNLGALLASAGRLTEAEQSFENAVRIDPDFSLSLQNLESIRTLRAGRANQSDASAKHPIQTVGASSPSGTAPSSDSVGANSFARFLPSELLTPKIMNSRRDFLHEPNAYQSHGRNELRPYTHESRNPVGARFIAPDARWLRLCRAENSAASMAGKNSPTLALIMIVKDEQDNLSELLPAISSCFDEIVIVDTGSSDKTVEIAQTFTEKVFHFAWNDDFSAARNFALSKARSDWILWLDADDRMKPEDVSLMKVHISSANKAFLLKVVSSAGGADAAEFIQLRLFPNLVGIAWEGRIHEQILPSMKRKGLEFELLAEASIIHTGYNDANILKKKTLRNIALLEKEQECRPDDSNVLHHLAQAYAIMGDIDKAIEVSETLVHILREHPISEFLTSAINRLIQWNLFKRDIDTAHEWCKRLLAMEPQNRLLRFFMGEIHYRKELFDEAIDWFTQFCAAKETIGLTPVPWAALDANAHNYLGLAFKQTGRREDARAEWRTAIHLGAKVEAYKNLALMCLEDGNAPEAESALRAALERGYSDADIWNNLGVALARAHRFIEAADAFRKALFLDPSNAAMRGNLDRIEHETRRQLSLNMIVRDEEKNLPEILAPIANLFDEIIIVDTGSKDNTVAIAEQFGARVIRHRWNDNFADARNAALNASTGKWVFWLDADDRIEPRAVRTLRKFIE